LRKLSGGQEVQADLLVRSWQNDPDVVVSFIPSNPPVPHRIDRIPYLRTMVRLPLYLSSLLTSLKDVDVAHIFSAASSSFLLCTTPAYWVSRALGKKIIVHYHSGRAPRHMTNSPFARDLLRSADSVIVPSDYLFEVFRDFGICAYPIPNLVETTQFHYRQRPSIQPSLLCSRNLEAWYGIDTMLQAFAEIKTRCPVAQLTILGTGSQEHEIRRLISQMKLENVELVGRITRQEIGRYYDDADILLNASTIDNMPVSILEAFASGIAVVTTNAGGIPHLVRHMETGILCNVGDWKALAANVLRLVQEPTLARRLAENAYRQSELYRWENVRSEWLCLYRRLVS
jgi:glycosyltransferase involved in cell wall biosynthesis